MSRKGLVLSIGVACFALLLALGCQQAAQPVPSGTPKVGEKAVATATKPAEKAAEKPVRGGTLRVAIIGERDSLDPGAAVTMDPMYTIYDFLIQPDKDGKVTKEGLFKDWTVSSDGKSITFKLQQGVKFQDGTDFDAAAAKFNIERMKDPATASPYRAFFDRVASVEVVDGASARFNLSAPDPLLIRRMATYAGLTVSPAAVKKYGKDFGRNPVGTGPFQFVEWAPGDHVTVKSFDGYWKKDKDGNKLPYLNQVVYTFIADGTVIAANLRTGQVDHFTTRGSGIPSELRPIIGKDPNLTYQTVAYLIQGTVMNTVRPPFANKALRQAVALALDREGMQGLWGETAVLYPSIIHPMDRAFDDGKSGVFPPRDVAKAKAKMAEAGYPSGGLKVKYSSGNTGEAVRNAEITKANLAEIGIEVEIEVFGASALNTKVRNDPWNYQIASTSLNLPIGDPGHYLENMFHSRGSRNINGPYSNTQVDQALEKALSTLDEKERAALYMQVAKVLVEDAPFVPAYLPKVYDDMNRKVRGYTIYPDNRPRFTETWLAQ